MGRLFTSVFQGVAVTAQQDMLSLLATATVPLKLHYFSCSQSTELGDAAEEQLRIRIRRGMTTVGSGGSAPSMHPVDPRELTTATATCRANDTTAASGGTIAEMWEENWNVRAPYIWVPTPKLQLICAISTRIAFNLVSTPADSITMSGTIVWEEAFE